MLEKPTKLFCLPSGGTYTVKAGARHYLASRQDKLDSKAHIDENGKENTVALDELRAQLYSWGRGMEGQLGTASGRDATVAVELSFDTSIDKQQHESEEKGAVGSHRQKTSFPQSHKLQAGDFACGFDSTLVIAFPERKWPKELVFLLPYCDCLLDQVNNGR